MATSSIRQKRRCHARPAERKATHVYVASNGHHLCKIGVSSNPERRGKSLSTNAPMGVTIAHSLRVGSGRAFDVERSAHAALSHLRTKGEWFFVEPGTAWLVVQLVASAPDRVEDLHLVGVRASVSARLRYHMDRGEWSKFDAVASAYRWVDDEISRIGLPPTSAYRRWKLAPMENGSVAPPSDGRAAG